MNRLNWAELLITLVMLCIAFIPALRKAVNNWDISKRYENFMKNFKERYHEFWVFFVLFIAAGVRLWKFGVIPAGFNQDGAMGAVDALALAHHGTDRLGMWLPVHFTAWGFGQMSVLLSYISVPFIALFGLNRYSARIAVVIVSLLALWVLYALCKILFGKKTALVILAFCAINPWQIMQSRWALDCNMLPHFFLFSIYFLCLSFKKRKRYLYISVLFFGLTMYTYGIAWYTVPLFLCAAGIYLLKIHKLTIRELSLSVLVYLLAAWPIFGVMVVNFFRLPTIHMPFFTIPFFPDTARKADILFFSDNFFKQLLVNFKATMNAVVLQKPDLPWNTIPEYGTVYLFSSPFAIIGLIGLLKMMKKEQPKKSAKNKKRIPLKPVEDGRYLYILLFIWVVIAFVSGLIINNVNVNRINIIFYPVIILIGLGIYMTVSRVRTTGIAILIVYIVAFGGFTTNYFGPHAQVIGSAFFDGFGEAMKYVKDLDYDRIYITSWTQSPNSWWVSEPLTMFHHQIDARYFQGKEDAYSKGGKKLLPYKERYRYVQMKDLHINPQEKAVYVVNENELEYFDTTLFNIVHFSTYSAVVPKSLN